MIDETSNHVIRLTVNLTDPVSTFIVSVLFGFGIVFAGTLAIKLFQRRKEFWRLLR